MLSGQVECPTRLVLSRKVCTVEVNVQLSLASFKPESVATGVDRPIIGEDFPTTTSAEILAGN